MKLYNLFQAYVGPIITFFASLCSIAGLILLFVNSKTACIVALVFFCIGMMSVFYGVLKTMDKIILEHSDKEYRAISSFYVYHSKDGRKSTFEVYRLIQCKRMFLSKIPYKFKWSGSKQSVLTSKAQTIECVEHTEDKNKWDHAFIKFDKPLRYNECTVVNVKSENDDFDGTAKPWISCNLESPIEMMLFRVMLSYKPDNFDSPAVFERKMIDSEIDGEYEYLESVEYNAGNKQYSFCKINPEPGYVYRLRWEK